MTVPMIKSIGDVPYPIDTHSDAFSPLLTAGAALGITGNDAEESAWLARTSEADGVATVKSIKGNTLVWNQLIGNETPTGAISLTSIVTKTGDAYIFNGTTTAGGNYYFGRNVHVVAGHKYLIGNIAKWSVDAGPNGGGAQLLLYDKDNTAIIGNIKVIGAVIVTAAATVDNADFYVNVSKADMTLDVIVYPQLFDLTQMFGAGNEPSTVAEFEALYPLPYYPYDAGSLLPVNMTGIESTGFNQWDEEWELGTINGTTGQNQTASNVIRSTNYIPAFPSTEYNANLDIVFYFYDADKGYLGNAANSSANSVITTPANCRYIRFRTGSAYGTTYNNDICINLSDPTRNGTYEPHWQQTRTIPAGTLRSAGTVYDELTKTGRITRVGERAYQSGDESDPTVTTDGTITYYPLATPTVTPIDPPLNMTYRTEQGGTERVMVPTGELSAPPTIVAAQGYTAESLRDAALATIAPVENGKASTNYGVGSYLVHGGQLCKVTTAIATGEAITIGTNVTATTVMAEILSLVQ